MSRLKPEKSLGACAVALCALSACAVEVEGPKEASVEATGVTREALISQTYGWSQGQGPTVMWPRSQGYCFLTGVAGHFAGTGEAVYVDMDSSQNYWILTGRSQQQGVRGSAACISWADMNGNKAANWTWGHWITEPASGSGFTSAPLWDGNSFCHLSGISGTFASGDDRAILTFNSTWWVEADNHYTHDVVAADGQCVWLHQNHPGLTLSPVYYWNQGSSAVYLGPVSDRMCALMEVQGHFQGSGESVSVYQAGGNWFLSGTSQQYGVGAQAQCVIIPE